MTDLSILFIYFAHHVTIISSKLDKVLKVTDGMEQKATGITPANINSIQRHKTNRRFYNKRILNFKYKKREQK